MITEQSSTWVHVSTADIRRRDGNAAEQVCGIFEIAMPISNGDTRSLALQSLRAHIIRLGLLGDDPALRIHSDGTIPPFARTSEQGSIYIHHRPANPSDTPAWPGIIELIQGDTSESI